MNLLGLSPKSLATWFTDQGESAFRAQQISKWIHQFGESDFCQMTNLAKTLRHTLQEKAEVSPPLLAFDRTSTDGSRKFLFDVGDNNLIESVFIPEADRGTLCISTQVGCALECSFCSTGKQGFNRNLTAAEIIGQLWQANHILKGPIKNTKDNQRKISNVVVMGMGEPLANLRNLIAALELMLDDHAYGLSRRRVTVSTSGLVPAMDELRDACPVALAVSLHAPNDALRDQLVPINQKYPISTLLAACTRYLEKAPRDFVTFEYVMIDGINDSLAQAKQLIEITKQIHCKINLIPFNPFPGSTFKRSSPERIRQFSDLLNTTGTVTTVRKTRGDDIDAACGQLTGQIQDRSKRRISHKLQAAIATLLLCFFLPEFHHNSWAQNSNTSRKQITSEPVNVFVKRHPAPPIERAKAHTNLAGLYFQSGELKIASEELDIALNASDNYAPAYSLRGLLHDALGETEKAFDDLKRALSLTPDDPEVNNNYGWLLCQHDKPKDAEPFLLKAANTPLYSTPERAYTNAGICAVKYGAQEKAEDYFLRALKVSKNASPNTRYELAKLYLQKSNLDKANQYIRGALSYWEKPPVEAVWAAVKIAYLSRDQNDFGTYVEILRNHHANTLEYQKYLRAEFN